MINDQVLSMFLKNPNIPQTKSILLPQIGNQGEHIIEWQLQFNRLSLTKMYTEYKDVVSKLMIAEMDEADRLAVLHKVMSVGQQLLAGLHYIYHNQTGFLNQSQQQALDTALSLHYLGIMFFHSVWKRTPSVSPQTPKKGLGALLGRRTEIDPNEAIIQHCVYGMMALLRHALYEKYIGYRHDTDVIWQTLNACYRFVLMKGWQEVVVPMPGMYSVNQRPTLQQIYHQCILAHTVNPYSIRRPDQLALKEAGIEWASELIVTSTVPRLPFLFVDLGGSQPPQTISRHLSSNPFAKNSQCLFINFERLDQHLRQLIVNANINKATNNKALLRSAQLVLDNVTTFLQPTVEIQPVSDTYEAIVGFYNIHFMLSNKLSFDKLIRASHLPGHLHPKLSISRSLEKSTNVHLRGIGGQTSYLKGHFHYQSLNELTPDNQLDGDATYREISLFEVQSLIAMRSISTPNQPWQLGRISHIQQSPTDCQMSNNTPTETINLAVEAQVKLISQQIVACGIRLYYPRDRAGYFVPALIVSKKYKEESHTTLIVAKAQYAMDERLILRIEDKEVQIILTSLVMQTDDIVEYNFMRLE